MTAAEREAGIAPAATRGNPAYERMRAMLAKVTADQARRN